MIKLVKVNKYFNRYKRNKNHIINNTSLEFANTGLVSILGNSGSGKTTLLNAIGGLDKVRSGKIYINGKRINKRPSFVIDKVRNINIGYIFQNYNLLNHLTVFENISIALKMSGVKNKEEIEKRVNYVLNVLGIYKYRQRLANMLSGGEKQRVAIARALVKNPSIIIADEPTGNLDSKNTIEIMNILKTISKDKLVILVTHEKNIAEFYASRIIEVVDGKVVEDKENIHDNDLDYRVDSNIYLKELKNYNNVKLENNNISIYSDTDERVDVKLVLKNGNIYIESKSHKVELVDDNSSIQLIDDVYKKISKEEQEKYKFNYENIINPKYKMKYTSIYNPFNLLIDGFKKVLSYSVLKKIMLLGFVFSSMFVLYAVSNIRGITDIKENNYITQNHDNISVIGKTTVEQFLNYSNLEDVDYVLPGNSLVQVNIGYDDFYQTKDTFDMLKLSLNSINEVTSDNLIYGNMPQNAKEIVLDKMVIDKLLSYSYGNASSLGLKSGEDFIGREVSLIDPYIRTSIDIDNYVIVGISDLGSPSGYVFNSEFIHIITNANEGSDSSDWGYAYFTTSGSKAEQNNIMDVNLIKNKIVIESGRMPEYDYEIIVPESLKDELKLNKTIDQQVNGNNLIVVGYYSSVDNFSSYYTTENTIFYDYIENSSSITVYPKDGNKEAVYTYFEELGLNVEDVLEENRIEYTNDVEKKITASVIVASVIVIISIIEIFLMLRSSFMSRVKEVGILRAIGMKKLDIYKMFIGEIIAILTLTTIPGMIFMSSILNAITQISIYADTFMLDLNTYLIAAILVIGVNIFFGLLPVYNVLRKTPARILSQNNVD